MGGISALVVMQPDAAASYRRIFERITGAFAGVAAAWLSLYVLQSSVLITGLIVLIAANMPHHINRRYWLHTGLIAWSVLLMYALGAHSEPEIRHLLQEPLLDMLVGCGIAVVGTWAAFGSFHARTT